jgi:hypothetical protein
MKSTNAKNKNVTSNRIDLFNFNKRGAWNSKRRYSF